MPNIELLESYPLYRKLKGGLPQTLDKVPKVPINMNCPHCGGIRTFLMKNEYWEAFGITNLATTNLHCKINYTCTACKSFLYVFQITFSSDNTWVMKSGQFPSWEIKTDPDVSRFLGKHKDLYTKGLVCESQSYGIAAFSYYRRIVEEIIDKLLSEVEELIEESERPKYKAALELTKSTRVTSDKIELIQDLLPSILRPKNMNPLSLLHGILSEGLHAGTDERCLELAVEAKEIIIFLVSRVTSASNEAREFTQRMQTLLQKKSKPNPTV